MEKKDYFIAIFQNICLYGNLYNCNNEKKQQDLVLEVVEAETHQYLSENCFYFNNFSCKKNISKYIAMLDVFTSYVCPFFETCNVQRS